MKTEMDLMKMDERQRLYWLMANRVALMIVFLVCLGIIIYVTVHNNIIPYFLIIMVPVFG